MNSSIDDKTIFQNHLSSSIDDFPTSNPIPPTKSRRGRKRVTDPVLVTQLKHHRRSRANDRERTRMRSLNEALEHLRTLLPIDSSLYYSSTDSSNHGSIIEDKLTKIETLRTASAYIRLLTDLLGDPNNNLSTLYNIPDYQYPSYPPACSYYHHPYC